MCRMSRIGKCHNLHVCSLYPCSFTALVLGSKSCTLVGVKVQWSPASYKLPVLNNESGNLGIMHAKVVSCGRFFKSKRVIKLDVTSFPLATLTLTVFRYLLQCDVLAWGLRKQFVAPESAMDDYILLTGGELQDVDEQQT